MKWENHQEGLGEVQEMIDIRFCSGSIKTIARINHALRATTSQNV